jgi:hypothetical protein
MQVVPLIVAAIAAVAGVALLWWRSRVGRELAVMMATETSRAADIKSKAPGTLVEVKGTLRADALLKGEFSQRECVYYRALLEREYERETTDADGKRDTQREFDTLTDNVRFSPCFLDDASGSVALDFTGAKVEAPQVQRTYERAGAAGSIIGGLLGAAGTTLGHRYTEWAIAAGVPVYVLGSVTAAGGIGAAPATSNPFVVSYKSEEERTRSLGRTRIWQVAGAVACFALAAVLLYWALQPGASAP